MKYLCIHKNYNKKSILCILFHYNIIIYIKKLQLHTYINNIYYDIIYITLHNIYIPHIFVINFVNIIVYYHYKKTLYTVNKIRFLRRFYFWNRIQIGKQIPVKFV